VLALLGGLQHADGPGLEVGERVRAVRRRELLHQVLARARHRLLHQLAHPVLHRSRTPVTEPPLQFLGELAVVLTEDGRELLLEVLVDRARLVRELMLERARGLLELRLHELRVRAGLLAVEHAGADLHGVEHRLHGVVAVLLALADEPDRAFVLDNEAVDGDAVTEHADVGMPEWSGCFHVD
jgi:hypothetical protein